MNIFVSNEIIVKKLNFKECSSITIGNTKFYHTHKDYRDAVLEAKNEGIFNKNLLVLSPEVWEDISHFIGGNYGE